MLAAAAAVLLLLHRWENRPTAQTEDDPYAGEDESLTYYNGGWYARRDVETVLVMGVDKYADDAAAEDSYTNQEQADFLLLLVLDRNAGVCTALPLNRDTMTVPLPASWHWPTPTAPVGWTAPATRAAPCRPCSTARRSTM